MWQPTFTTLALALAATDPLLAQAVASGDCPRPRSTTATIGVGMYGCYGGNCVLFDSTGGVPSHTFTVEPRLLHVKPGGPADGKLRDGDALVAVNGALITTSEAGRTLANPIAGRAIRFRVRRSAAVIETEVTPAAGCEDLTISIADGPDEAESVARARQVLNGTTDISGFVRAATPEEVPVDFGMSLDCIDCGWRVPFFGGPLQWHSASHPRVAAVEPAGPAAQGGVRVGDVLESIDGASFAGADASPTWAAMRPDQPATLRLRRGGTAVRVIVTPRRPRRARL